MVSSCVSLRECFCLRKFMCLALHAHRLRINHPVSGEPLQLEAPRAPALLDFVAALERFQDDSRRSS